MYKKRLDLKLKLIIVVSSTMMSLYGIIVIAISRYTVPAFRTDAMERYKYHNARITQSFEKFITDIDSITSQIINEPVIQDSLYDDLTLEKNRFYITHILNRYLAPPIENVMYIDNKGRIVTTLATSNTTLETIMKTNILTNLRSSYAKPNLNLENDRIFLSQNKPSLFISYNIHHLSLDIPPGILIFKINWDNVLEKINTVDNTPAITVLLNNRNDIVYTSADLPTTKALIEEMEKDNVLEENSETSWLFDSRHFYVSSTDPRSGWKIINIVSDKEMLSGIYIAERQLFIIISSIILISIFSIFLFTSRIIRPIEEDILMSQEKLKQAELNSLIYQINPHLLYNVLENLYMMARGSKDKTMCKLIEALSSFLRISISKGENIITVQKEFDHVQSYLTIQKIRYGELFEYNIEIDEEVGDYRVLKLILQPVVENSIKHGFEHIQSGGIIWLSGRKSETGRLEFIVSDNGCGMTDETIGRINSIKDIKDIQISKVFPHYKGGYGIANVIARLRIYYGENFDFKYSRECEKTVCRISLGNLSSQLIK